MDKRNDSRSMIILVKLDLLNPVAVFAIRLDDGAVELWNENIARKFSRHRGMQNVLMMLM